jgi:hypothetical protein
MRQIRTERTKRVGWPSKDGGEEALGKLRLSAQIVTVRLGA